MGQDTEKKAYQNHLQTPRINIYEPPFLDLFLVWTIIIYSLSYYLESSSWRPLDILPWLNLYTVLISEKKSRELSILYNLLYAFFFYFCQSQRLPQLIPGSVLHFFSRLPTASQRTYTCSNLSKLNEGDQRSSLKIGSIWYVKAENP